MMFAETLSIDLGAAYTKIAHRKSCLPGRRSPGNQRAELYMSESGPLIPSIAIQTHRQDQPWVFGWDAASITPGPKMKVYQNWKSNLFAAENSDQTAAAAIVACEFFRWLKGIVTDAGIDLDKAETRIAMPALPEFEKKALLIAQCMEMADWPSSKILRATEPHTNALGIYSEGRNVINRAADGTLLPDYGRMFRAENPLIQAARDFALNDRGTNIVKIIIVDIGAFTSDIAALKYDIATPLDDLGVGLRKIEESSVPLGIINDLDSGLFNQLGNSNGVDWNTLTFNSMEDCKRAVYAGRIYTIPTQAGGTVDFGTPADQAVVSQYIQEFVRKLWAWIEEQIGRDKPQFAYLTGGGSLIDGVSGALRSKFDSLSIVPKAFPDADQQSGEGQWIRWEDTDIGLNRIATAIGGASVVNQIAGDLEIAADPERRAPQVWREDPTQTACRCQGGNKDCCFCFGRGFYNTRSAGL